MNDGIIKKLWQEVESDLREKSPAGYKMALLDADKALRWLLKQKGYPGKNISEQLFWSGIKIENHEELKRAFEKKDEILESVSYQLSTLELEDFLDIYKELIRQLSETKKLRFYQRAYFLFEKNFSHNLRKILKLGGLGLVAYLIIVKLLTSTESGRRLVEKIVALNNFIFKWLLNIIIFTVIIAVIIGIIFLLMERRRSVRIKDE